MFCFTIIYRKNMLSHEYFCFVIIFSIIRNRFIYAHGHEFSICLLVSWYNDVAIIICKSNGSNIEEIDSPKDDHNDIDTHLSNPIYRIIFKSHIRFFQITTFWNLYIEYLLGKLSRFPVFLQLCISMIKVL